MGERVTKIDLNRLCIGEGLSRWKEKLGDLDFVYLVFYSLTMRIVGCDIGVHSCERDFSVTGYDCSEDVGATSDVLVHYCVFWTYYHGKS